MRTPTKVSLILGDARIENNGRKRFTQLGENAKVKWYRDYVNYVGFYKVFFQAWRIKWMENQVSGAQKGYIELFRDAIQRGENEMEKHIKIMLKLGLCCGCCLFSHWPLFENSSFGEHLGMQVVCAWGPAKTANGPSAWRRFFSNMLEALKPKATTIHGPEGAT